MPKKKVFRRWNISRFFCRGIYGGFSQNRISNIDTAPTFSITKAGAVFFSVSGNDESRLNQFSKIKHTDQVLRQRGR